MLKRGYTLAYTENEARFATFADCKRKSEFAYFMAEKYGLSSKYIMIGYRRRYSHGTVWDMDSPAELLCGEARGDR